MTEEQKNEILCYVAQNILAPFCDNKRLAIEVWDEMIGEPFNKLCKLVGSMVEGNNNGNKKK